MGMTKSQYDGLDELAQAVVDGKRDNFGGISTGERIYAALAANRPDLMPQGFTIVEALARLGDDDVRELIRRWEYRR